MKHLIVILFTILTLGLITRAHAAESCTCPSNGLLSASNSSNSSFPAVQGLSSVSEGVGVLGSSSNGNGFGVVGELGYDSIPTVSPAGVYGASNVNYGIGIFAQQLAGLGGYGLYASAYAGVGVYGTTGSNSASNAGVVGANTNQGYGVYGSTTGTGSAVFGVNTSSSAPSRDHSARLRESQAHHRCAR